LKNRILSSVAARHLRKARSLIGIAAVLALLAAPAQAQDEDEQLWLKAGASAQLRAGVELKLETNQRFGNDRGGIYESQYLFAAAFEIAEGVTVTAGVNRVVGFTEGKVDYTEWRPRQQIDFSVAKIGSGDLAGRVRIEQRLRSDDGEPGHTVRPAVSYTIPLRGEWEFELAHESYFNLNGTDNQDTGHERMRNSAALSFPIGDRLKGEVGYLNQYRFNRDEADLMEHALTTSLQIEF